MDTVELQARMWVDLLTSELRAEAERQAVTERARLYLESGLPLERVLDALKVSRATWYRRVADHDAWRAANKSAGDRAMRQVEKQAAEAVRKALEEG